MFYFITAFYRQFIVLYETRFNIIGRERLKRVKGDNAALFSDDNGVLRLLPTQLSHGHGHLSVHL